MKPSCMIHAGFGKCWSTTIQNFLELNSKLLEEQGVYYSANHQTSNFLLPMAIGERAYEEYIVAMTDSLVSDLSPEEAFWREYQSAISINANVMMYSSEFFENLASIDLLSLRMFLENHFSDISIILFARDPLARLASAAQQAIKVGLANFNTPFNSYAYPMESIYNKFTNAFGNNCVHMHFISNTTGFNGIVSFLEDVLSITLSSSSQKVKILNPSISIDSAFMLNYYSIVDPLIINEKINLFRLNHYHLIESKLAALEGPRFSFPSELYASAQEYVSDDNLFLKQLFNIECNSQSYCSNTTEWSLNTLKVKYPDSLMSFIISSLKHVVQSYADLDENARLIRSMLYSSNGLYARGRSLCDPKLFNNPECKTLASHLHLCSQEYIQKYISDIIGPDSL